MKIGEIEMITDRTSSDVVFAKQLLKKGLANMTTEEKDLFLSGLKGAYNYTDFNRVEYAVRYVVDEMTAAPNELKQHAESLGVYFDESFSLDYDTGRFAEIETKEENYWSVDKILTADDRTRYLSNAKIISSVFGEASDRFPLSLDGLTHVGANEIEKGIENTYVTFSYNFEEKKSLIEETYKAWFYSGDLYGGEI